MCQATTWINAGGVNTVNYVIIHLGRHVEMHDYKTRINTLKYVIVLVQLGSRH